MFLGKISSVTRTQNSEFSPRFIKESKVPLNGSAFISNYFEDDQGQLDLKLPDGEAEADTAAQTSLRDWIWVIRFLRLFFYYLVGVCVYEYYENWSFIDSVWFITQTFTTLGYGNITPKSKGGRMFTIFFIFIGMALAFFMINDATRLAILYFRTHYRKKNIHVSKKKFKRNKFQLLVRSFFNCLMWITIVILVCLFGATVFCLNEGWTWNDSVYFTVVTMTSLGYGDVVPQKDSSIWFNIFFILVTIPLTVVSLEKITSFRRHYDRADLWQILEEIELSKPLLEAIDKKDRKVSKSDYILHMLQLEGKLDYLDDLLRWEEKFKSFDLDRDGQLTMHDVEVYQARLLKERMRANSFASGRTRSAAGGNHPSVTAASFSRTPSIVHAFLDETKDVFYETFGLSSLMKAGGGGGGGETPDGVTMSPFDRNNSRAGDDPSPESDHDNSNNSHSYNSYSQNSNSYNIRSRNNNNNNNEEEEEEDNNYNINQRNVSETSEDLVRRISASQHESPMRKAKALRDASIVSTTKSMRKDRSMQEIAELGEANHRTTTREEEDHRER
jgi:hypothetical protein